MPPIRQHEPAGSSTTASSQPNGTSAKNVWFYMTGSKTSTRPHDDELQRYFEEDIQRQKSGLTYQRPQESRIRCVVCLLEKDKWQTWHNRAGPIAKILRQHLDGRHAIICTDDGGEQNTEPQQSAKPTSSAAKNKSESTPLSTKSTTTEKSQSSVEAPRFGHSKSVSQATTSKLPSPSSSESQNEEPSKPRPRAPKSVEKLRAELDKVKAECELAKVERDEATRERQLLKEELRRLKEAERAKDEELLKLSNLVSSSLKALVKK
ncbi:unnamed protein product [Rhizoctonia solani]|uniref:Uncharacterized protein n=1 Tax=Rhizoctonia solani TaxID=456999 RepID=A0A8H2X1Q2_9AGAM|nr:unnamed protein product [Rhizoctonia solani]